MICGSEIIGVKFKRVTAHFYAVVARLLFSNMIYGNIAEYLRNVAGRGVSIRTGV